MPGMFCYSGLVWVACLRQSAWPFSQRGGCGALGGSLPTPSLPSCPPTPTFVPLLAACLLPSACLPTHTPFPTPPYLFDPKRAGPQSRLPYPLPHPANLLFSTRHWEALLLPAFPSGGFSHLPYLRAVCVTAISFPFSCDTRRVPLYCAFSGACLAGVYASCSVYHCTHGAV